MGAVALGATVVGLATIGEMSQQGNGGSAPDAPSSWRIADAAPSAVTRALPVRAWVGHGGGDLLRRFPTAARDFLDLLDKGQSEVDGSSVQPFCAEFDRIATDAAAYFPVPDPQARARWLRFIAQTRTLGQDCDNAVAQSNGDLLVKTASDINPAEITGTDVGLRINAVMKTGGG